MYRGTRLAMRPRHLLYAVVIAVACAIARTLVYHWMR